ncbi:beta-N-acetylhexosaminidase [Telmatospirillum sp.]|uniref:beta-N-acetylhexosaminidase n=1 Tax=Telmatospirillum sp. TaxID=2079197 RepID=UPI00284DEBFB|nr:beta-N-acetylhexosaminidase [Telmatospirillum sp.]MDR3435990.1 beta-N-acetylhexosaminidase [Telmatospirillum sp.]
MPKNSIPYAAVFGCSGLTLTDEEKRFFDDVDPFGFILFGRNVGTPLQVAALVDELRNCVGRRAPVLIDQEGGRVQRLKPPHWRRRPPMEVFGRLAERDLALARRAAWLDARIMADELFELGIDVDCAPLLDLRVSGADDIVGDRAFGSDPALVADLGRAVMDGLLDGTVIPVVKHLPGHGRALVDSHLDLPVVDADLKTLESSDFAPFRSLRDAPWAMTAHVVYSALDPHRPATTSKRVIETVIRGAIGCEGVLLSDDLSMKAMKGGFAERAQDSLDAGCDIVLHCNGDMAEMQAIALALKPLSDGAQMRLARADSMLRNRPLPVDADATLDNWLAENGR